MAWRKSQGETSSLRIMGKPINPRHRRRLKNMTKAAGSNLVKASKCCEMYFLFMVLPADRTEAVQCERQTQGTLCTCTPPWIGVIWTSSWKTTAQAHGTCFCKQGFTVHSLCPLSSTLTTAALCDMGRADLLITQTIKLKMPTTCPLQKAADPS
jgi:hypothetical protein